MISSIPSGTVTFLFTDIEGSTKLAQAYSDEMPALLARHHEILHECIQSHDGYVFQVVGDSFAAAFQSANDALKAALDAQQSLQREPWSPAPVRVRIGLHTGIAHLNPASAPTVYTGYATIALAQRIMSAGAFAAIGNAMPSAWAMNRLQNILIRGLGLESVWMAVGILSAYALFFFVLAVWRFRRIEV